MAYFLTASLMFKRIIPKIGSNSITHTLNGPDSPKVINTNVVNRLGYEAHTLVTRMRREMGIISSGAVPLGELAIMNQIAEEKAHNDGHSRLEEVWNSLDSIRKKQFAAGFGQADLMQVWKNGFSQPNLIPRILVGQKLITPRSFSDEMTRKDANAYMDNTLRAGQVFIGNEDDTQARQEISETTHGDNDGMSVQVAMETRADLLIFITEVGGFFEGGHPVREAEKAERIDRLSHDELDESWIKEHDYSEAGDDSNGGLGSKARAARLAGDHGITTFITSEKEAGAIIDAANGDFSRGTVILPRQAG